MIKKKILALLCAAAFALTACGSGENDVSNAVIAGSATPVDETGVTQQMGSADTDAMPQSTAAALIMQNGSFDGISYSSTGDDENALRIIGALVTLSNITVNKSSGTSSNTENGEYYGLNAALLAADDADVTITDATVTSSVRNGNGVFCYGGDTMVNISDSTITTTGDYSCGLQTTGGGTTSASNLTVSTTGRFSAAICSDRGGGTVDVVGGSYTSQGVDSPAIYSSADITASHAQLTAMSSEALVIEGKNSITLKDCTVSGRMHDTDGASSDENVHTVMLYQATSDDASVGAARFSMTGGSLTGGNGDLFFLTNTTCELSLSGVTLENTDPDGNLMTVSGNSAQYGWGEAGANGAQASVTVNNQLLEGSIVVDSISSLQLHLTGASTLQGTINIVENEQDGEAVDNNASVTVDKGSSWSLTGDCTVTSLENHGEIRYNGYTITLADGTVMGE